MYSGVLPPSPAEEKRLKDASPVYKKVGEFDGENIEFYIAKETPKHKKWDKVSVSLNGGEYNCGLMDRKDAVKKLRKLAREIERKQIEG